MFDTRTNRLNDQPHGLFTHLRKALQPQNIMRGDGGFEPCDIGIDITKRAGIHLKGFKLVMAVVMMMVVGVVFIIIVVMVVMLLLILVVKLLIKDF